MSNDQGEDDMRSRAAVSGLFILALVVCDRTGEMKGVAGEASSAEAVPVEMGQDTLSRQSEGGGQEPVIFPKMSLL